MIVTKKYIKELRESGHKVSVKAERILLEELGQEPELDNEGHQNIYSEQDIWEQTREIIRDN